MQKIVRVVMVMLLAAGVFLPSNNVSAQQNSGAGGNGIRISPVRSDITVNPGESRTLVLTVQNITGTGATFQAITNDFIPGNNEDGQPALILDSDKFAPSHSLKRYIAAIPNITVASGDSKNVNVTITVPKDAAAGGYYGAVRFTPTGANDASKNVTLSASVGSLILVRVPGDVKENISLLSFEMRKGIEATKGSAFFTTNKDLYAVARFKNSGNVHEQPFGKIVLRKGTKVLQTVEINNTDPRGNVLPDSVRRFPEKLDKVGSFGKFTIDGNFGYGTNGQLLSGSTSFWVIPLPLIVGVIVLLALLIGLIVGLPKAIKRYNQNVIRRSGRR